MINMHIDVSLSQCDGTLPAVSEVCNSTTYNELQCTSLYCHSKKCRTVARFRSLSAVPFVFESSALSGQGLARKCNHCESHKHIYEAGKLHFGLEIVPNIKKKKWCTSRIACCRDPECRVFNNISIKNILKRGCIPYVVSCELLANKDTEKYEHAIDVRISCCLEVVRHCKRIIMRLVHLLNLSRFWGLYQGHERQLVHLGTLSLLCFFVASIWEFWYKPTVAYSLLLKTLSVWHSKAKPAMELCYVCIVVKKGK